MNAIINIEKDMKHYRIHIYSFHAAHINVIFHFNLHLIFFPLSLSVETIYFCFH